MKTKKVTISEFIKTHPATIEVIVSILAVTFLIYILRSMLLFRESTLAHDNLLWNYPVFHFFAENIINGCFPFWDPFSYGGEPFYPILVQMRLLEPITLLIIYSGKFFTNDILTLFNWNRFIQSLMMTFGVYIVFRPIAAHLLIRLSLIPILLFSSFMLGSFRQDAILNQFLWIPIITYFLLRTIYYKDYRWHNWLILACIIGLNWQSYFFTGTWIFLLFFSVGIALFYRNLLSELFQAKTVIVKFTVTIVIISAMAMPNIVLMLEKDKYVFPARMVNASELLTPEGGPIQYEGGLSSNQISGINMPYSLIALTGTFSSIWDFIQIIAPDGNKHIRWPGRERWGRPSEAYMFIGLLPWAIALLGLVVGRHELKRLWLFLLISFGLFMLGPSGGLHWFLYYIYPPIWFVRHTHTFVLFFIFAFLYFYVLGLNHIFSTWDISVFEPPSSTGILERFIKRDYIKHIAILIFSAAVVLSVYWMTKIAYPYTNYLFVFIALIFTLGWILWKDLGERGLYISLLVSQLAIILIFSTNTYKFARYITPALGLSLALFIFIKTQKKLSKTMRYNLLLVLLLVFSIALTIDLMYSFRKSSFLYGTPVHPAISNKIDTTIQKSYSLQDRSVYPKEFVISHSSDQSMRYLSLVYRKPFALSSIKDPDYSFSKLRVKNDFKGFKNKSFELWTLHDDDYYPFLPMGFVSQQGERNGGVKRYTGSDGVKDGNASVLLIPSTSGNSFIRYRIYGNDIKEIRNQHIRVSAWVKSQNKTIDAIQLDIQSDDGKPLIVKSYNNSGDWERIELVKYVSEKTSNIIITYNIKSSATAPAYVDKANIEIVEIDDTFEYALRSRRWSNFLLYKNYFKLINMEIPPKAIEAMFAVNMPVFQFKEGVVNIKEDNIPSFFGELYTVSSVNLLKKYVLIDGKVDSSLHHLNILPREYKNMVSLDAVKHINTSEDIKGMKEKTSFRYNIEKFDSNSVNMNVFSDKDGILYWADGYDKNWRAYVNGEEVPIYRANVNFKAIYLTKGTYKINFVYNPFLFKAGLLIFYGIFGVCFLAAAAVRGFTAVFYVFRNDKEVI